MADETCGYVGRFLALLTVFTAIILGIVGASNCNFLRFENDRDEPWERLESPFNGTFQAHVGIFSYEIIEAVDENRITDGCVGYDSKIGGSNYEAITAAQFCAIFAPIIGFAGLVVSCLDTCVCRFCCSFLISSALYLAACGVQAGTFSVFAEPDFCFEGEQYCNVGISVYMCGVASVLYFVACLFLCCFPTPDPFCSRKPAPERGREPNRVVVQPVVIDQHGKDQDGGAWDYDGDNDDRNGDYSEESYTEKPPKPSRKTSKVKDNKDAKITDDDFDFEVPTEGTSRVEYVRR